MTRDEVKKLFTALSAAFQEFYRGVPDEDVSLAISMWAVALEEYPADFIMRGMKKLMREYRYARPRAVDVIKAAKDSCIDLLDAITYFSAGVPLDEHAYVRSGGRYVRAGDWVREQKRIAAVGPPRMEEPRG
jgi:hypothetical protein